MRSVGLTEQVLSPDDARVGADDPSFKPLVVKNRTLSYGISRVWVHKLVHRYQREGPVTFESRLRRPHSNPRAVGLEVENQVVRLRCAACRRRSIPRCVSG